MSVHPELVTDGPIDGRLGYQIVPENSTSDLTAVNIDLWEDKANIEWRTETQLREVYEILDGVDSIEDNDRFLIYMTSEEESLKQIKGSYDEVKKDMSIFDLAGNFRLSREDSFEFYWENTNQFHTIELTLLDQAALNLLDPVYRQTALETAPTTEELFDEYIHLRREY